MNRNTEPCRALIYAGILPIIRDIAHEHGYAIGVHGSMQTDLDLIACPWTEEAGDAKTLARAIRDRFEGQFSPDPENENGGIKPHGRRAWTIQADSWKDISHIYSQGWGVFLDISVMPRYKKKEDN